MAPIKSRPLGKDPGTEQVQRRPQPAPGNEKPMAPAMAPSTPSRSTTPPPPPPSTSSSHRTPTASVRPPSTAPLNRTIVNPVKRIALIRSLFTLTTL